MVLRPKLLLNVTTPDSEWSGTIRKQILDALFSRVQKNDSCDYFEWGDKTIIAKPLCHHGKPCKLREVKKEGSNQGRSFLCCPERGEKKCKFFRWFETTCSRESDDKKADDEFQRLDEENPFFSPDSGTLFSNFQKRKTTDDC